MVNNGTFVNRLMDPKIVFYKLRAYSGTVNCKLPLPLKNDPNHNLKLSVRSVNQKKNNQGETACNIAQELAIKKWMVLTNSLDLSPTSWSYTPSFSFDLFKEKLKVTVED